ncbi:integrase family protein [Desulfonatronospira thiodismutans ASO3-1]|uniref:Integrase family protein n=1 Tax=Desulfonatronospira thiodismutans ASO3-1 TaxID=555779 RepID=D6SV12_9BACT|nr:site-specific integrase [Desulfonatronospira thiodismutans]EFI32768.1 integrase family protein [Desulfonatronospira thiodismutans ASO3-1]
MANTNHPQKGSNITVEPIRSLEDIKSIKKLLSGNPRDHLLFTMGINNGLRIGDLLQLKVRDVQGVKPGDTIRVREQKTGKTNILVINKATHKALQTYLSQTLAEPENFLFKSQKGNAPLTVSYANRMIKDWCRQINLRGNYGTHTLRKTFGYIQRVHYGVGYELLCKRFNHSSPAVTMRYLGIEDKKVNNILMHEI